MKHARRYLLFSLFMVWIAGILGSDHFNPGAGDLGVRVSVSAPDTSGPIAPQHLDNIFKTFPTAAQINSRSTEPRTSEPVGMGNPAAVYCQELGYQYQLIQDEQGERGICLLPDQVVCDAWAFLQGKCGQIYNYCAREGFYTVVRQDGEGALTPSYAVCLDLAGKELGPVTELMNLTEKSLGCGVKEPEEVHRSAPDPGTSPQATELAPPTAFDWRNYQGENWLTPIRNQAECGSCWAFAAVGVTEALYNIAYFDPELDLNLSEQYLVSDCYNIGYLQNCCGGWKSMALEYIRDEGLPDEDCLQYQDGTAGKDGSTCACQLDGACGSGCEYRSLSECSDFQCSERCSDWNNRLRTINQVDTIGSWIWLPTDTEIKQALVDYGPLAVSVGIDYPVGGSFGAAGYPPDVYSCEDDDGINHAVVLVGYNDPGGYWIVRNSWGTGWNGDGYYKLAYGECSLNYEVIYGVVEPEVTFSDVLPSNWAYHFIEGIAQVNLTSGYPDGTYRPENPVTRAEMAVFLLNGMGIPTPAVDGSHPFSDLSGHWAESHIEELYDQGVTGGYPDGSYRPEALASRSEMAVFLLNAMALTPSAVDASHPFSDISGHWAEIFIEELYDQGITGGYPDGTYRPENQVTRAEMAVFLVNAFNIPLP